jgi:hypothetical protein
VHNKYWECQVGISIVGCYALHQHVLLPYFTIVILLKEEKKGEKERE